MTLQQQAEEIVRVHQTLRKRFGQVPLDLGGLGATAVAVAVADETNEQELGMRTTGKVIAFNTGRGFGFIQTADKSATVFTHISQLIDRKHLVQGQTVEFDIEHDEAHNKPIAVKVVVIAEPEIVVGSYKASQARVVKFEVK